MLDSTPATTQSQRLHKSRRSRRKTLSTASTEVTSCEVDHVPTIFQHQCCGFVEEAASRAREKRENRTIPQPWIVRKLAVFLTLGIMGYSGYVYISRFCISSIKRMHQSATGRPTASEYSFRSRYPGIGLKLGAIVVVLVVFCVLYLWMIWAYFKVRSTLCFCPRYDGPIFTRWLSRRQVMPEMYVCSFATYRGVNFSTARTSMSTTTSRTTRYPTLRFRSGKFTHALQLGLWPFKITSAFRSCTITPLSSTVIFLVLEP